MKTTLKDIAQRCGVSVMLVSSVLNRKQKGIGCSQALSDKILRTAKEMDYHPNLLARSMVSKHSPVIAVMLNLETSAFLNGSSSYFNSIFPALTLAFNNRNFEVLFVPFQNEKEQCNRINRLVNDGIAGAIVTNLCPQSYSQAVPLLISHKLPYMILGYPQGFSCHCVYGIGEYSWCKSYEKEHDISQTYLLTKNNGELKFYPLPWPNDYMWLATPLPFQQSILQDSHNLILCSGMDLYSQMNYIPEHVIVLEDNLQLLETSPGLKSVLLKVRRKEIIQLAVEHICTWITTNHPPEIQTHCLQSEAVTFNF